MDQSAELLNFWSWGYRDRTHADMHENSENVNQCLKSTAIRGIKEVNRRNLDAAFHARFI